MRALTIRLKQSAGGGGDEYCIHSHPSAALATPWVTKALLPLEIKMALTVLLLMAPGQSCGSGHRLSYDKFVVHIA